MKKTHTSSGLLLSLLLVGCVSSPKFVLDGQEQFNNTALLGNWVCASETDLSKNNTELVMINSWQEMLDEEGSYFSVGTAEFKLNGKSAGTIQIIIDGEWIANEEHFMTRGQLAKVFAHPASSEPVVKLANSRNFFKNTIKTRKARYSLTPNETMQRSPNGNNEEPYICFSWNTVKENCDVDPHPYCDMKRLDSQQIEVIQDRYLADL